MNTTHTTYAVCPRCNAVIAPDTPHTCPPVVWVWLHCNVDGKHYPDYAGTNEQVGLRYCGTGDLISVKADDMQPLLDAGLCERYAVGGNNL